MKPPDFGVHIAILLNGMEISIKNRIPIIGGEIDNFTPEMLENIP